MTLLDIPKNLVKFGNLIECLDFLMFVFVFVFIFSFVFVFVFVFVYVFLLFMAGYIGGYRLGFNWVSGFLYPLSLNVRISKWLQFGFLVGICRKISFPQFARQQHTSRSLG